MVKTVFSGGEDMARIKNDFQMKVNWGFIRNMEMIDPSNSSSYTEEGLRSSQDRLTLAITANTSFRVTWKSCNHGNTSFVTLITNSTIINHI